MKAKRIEVFGKVQSVGFRPFIYNLAKKFNLTGYVKNKTSYVEILVEGKEENLEKFIKDFSKTHPIAQIEKILIKEDHIRNLDSFKILESEQTTPDFIYIPADIKICDECIKELLNPKDRRYLYPFINCTQCGPRFTIIEELPYDRKNTTMKIFKMCEDCLNEYQDPLNRRFHAQPNACYKCGPGLMIKDNNLKTIFKLTKSAEDVEKVLDFIVKKILEGKILAIKSFGGYHLVCDATNDDVVFRLRKSKNREFKPFAMMAYNLDIIRKYSYVDKESEKLLSSSQSPIVLLLKKPNIEEPRISEFVSVESNYYGFMLPYTPLQYLIFYWLNKNNKNIPLIMTSGNLSDEPQVFKETQAFEKLKDIADYFLIYNRKINIRCDDSVCRVFNNDVYFIRRSRGWSPEPIFVNYNFKKQILAFGADLKNTFSLAKDNYVIVSHHIGDLDNLDAIDSFSQSIEYYLKTFKFKPDLLVCDLHPLYESSKIAKEFAKNNSIECITLQHHYAHMLSCMLENGIFERCIGVIFDGTGYGLDNTIWGSEFLVGDISSFIRKAHFEPISLVGADISIKQPYRNALAFLYKEYKDKKLIKDFWSFITNKLESKQNKEISFSFEEIFDSIKFLVENNINIVSSCGMGRIFDIVAFLCGLGFFNYYEGYLPQNLEYIGSYEFKEIKDEIYTYEIKYQDNKYIANTRLLLKEIFEDVFFNKKDVKKISAKFHNTISKISVEIILKIREELNINKVVLSGGVFQNQILLFSIYNKLQSFGFEVFIHRKVPCNDAGISFGQTLGCNIYV